MKTSAKLLWTGLMVSTLWSTPEQAAGSGLAAASTALPVGAMTDAAYGNGICVKIDARGRLMTSEDGATWIVPNLRLKTFIRAVVYGNGLFVAVGGSYVDEPGVILTSHDGVAWIRQKSPLKANLYGVTYGCGMFVAVGDHDTILTSKNSSTWKKEKAPTSGMLFSAVSCGNGCFLVVGDSGTVLASTNGADWTRRRSGTSMYLTKVVTNESGFVMQGSQGAVLIGVEDLTRNK